MNKLEKKRIYRIIKILQDSKQIKDGQLSRAKQTALSRIQLSK